MLRRKGFTLVEVMIVVLILAILISIAVPQFLRSRQVSWQRTCQSNLRSIESAKEQWAMETRRQTGDPCDIATLSPDYIKANLTCPAGGTYTPQAVGTRPTCSFVNLGFPHTAL